MERITLPLTPDNESNQVLSESLRELISGYTNKVALAALVGDLDEILEITSNEKLRPEDIQIYLNEVKDAILQIESMNKASNEEVTDPVCHFKKIQLTKAFNFLRFPENLKHGQWRSVISAFSVFLTKQQFPAELHADIMFNFLGTENVTTERLQVLIDDTKGVVVEDKELDMISEFAYRYFDIISGKVIFNRNKLMEDLSK